MSETSYAQIAERIAGLGERPVSDHPRELEAVHRDLVSQLERISNSGTDDHG